MSRHTDFEVKDLVRESTNIVDLIESYIPLQRQGRLHIGLCPWHDDSKPSLQVNPLRQSWKCWVCDVGGDAFSFVMKREGVNFREALQMLAERAHIELPKLPTTKSGSPNDKSTLFDATRWASEQFHHCLMDSPQAEVARNYLAERGIEAGSIQRFGIGFAPPGYSWLVDRGRSTDFSEAVFTTVGLFGQTQDGRPYDFFRGRLMFPIRDTQQRTIGFGGRILPEFDDGKSGKYVNSRETRLFSKSENFYGLDLAIDDLTKRGELTVMEGYTDVIMAHQHGITSAVAVLGTALNERHLKQLRRYGNSSRVTLVLDGDAAGQRRTNEILDLFIQKQADLRVVTLPDGMDPCDFIQQNGKEAFDQKLSQSVDALEHKVNVATKEIENSPHARHQAVEEILSSFSKAPADSLQSESSARIRMQQMINQLSRLFQIPEEDLRSRMAELREQSRPRLTLATTDEESKDTTIPPRERELLQIVLFHNQLIPRLSEIEEEWIVSDTTKEILLTIRTLLTEEIEPSFNNVMNYAEELDLKNILASLDAETLQKEERVQETPEERWISVVRAYKREIEDKETQVRLAKLAGADLASEEEASVLEEIIRSNRERQGLEM